MERADTVLDTSFWINVGHAGLAAHLLEFFRLWAPPAVVREATTLLKAPTRVPEHAVRFAEWLSRGDISLIEPSSTEVRFDAGENEAIALARERGWILLIDDQYPRHYSGGPMALA